MKMFFAKQGIAAAVLAATFAFAAPAFADGSSWIDVGSSAGAFSPSNTVQTGNGSSWVDTQSASGGWLSSGYGYSASDVSAQGSNSGSAGASGSHNVAGSATGQISGFLGTSSSLGSSFLIETTASAAVDDGASTPGNGAGSASVQTGGNGTVGFQYAGSFVSFDNLSFGDTSSSVGVNSSNQGRGSASTGGLAYSTNDVSLGGQNLTVGSQTSANAVTVGNATAFGNTWNETNTTTSVSGLLNGSWTADTDSIVSASANSTNGGSASGSASAGSFASNNGL